MPAPIDSQVPPLRELVAYLAQTVSHCRAARWFGALFHVSVAQDIAADVARQHTTLAAEGYSAEQEDLEACRLIDAVLADGRVTPCELPALAEARRLIARSARRDREISDQLA